MYPIFAAIFHPIIKYQLFVLGGVLQQLSDASLLICILW